MAMLRWMVWLVKEDNWKILIALTYAAISIMDFILIPTWIGLMRPPIDLVMSKLPEGAESVVQLEYLKLLVYHHSPLTLQSGGLFHLAFGAILTGTAVVGNRPQLQPAKMKEDGN